MEINRILEEALKLIDDSDDLTVLFIQKGSKSEEEELKEDIFMDELPWDLRGIAAGGGGGGTPVTTNLITMENGLGNIAMENGTGSIAQE